MTRSPYSGSDSRTPHLDVLCAHFSEGGEMARAAIYAEEAGRLHAERNYTQEAIRRFQQAILLLRSAGDTEDERDVDGFSDGSLSGCVRRRRDRACGGVSNCESIFAFFFVIHMFLYVCLLMFLFVFCLFEYLCLTKNSITVSSKISFGNNKLNI